MMLRLLIAFTLWFTIVHILVGGFPKVARSSRHRTNGKVSLSESTSRPISQLALSPSILSTAESLAALTSVVTFHEAGHFFAARWQGIKVTSFNIGFGPKLASVNDSSQIEYALRAIPFGGYVAFPANVERDEEGEIIKELTDPELLQNRPPLQRLFVISAGVIANFLLTLSLSTGEAIIQGINTPVYGNGIVVSDLPDVSSPAYKAGIRPKDVILKANGMLIKGDEATVETFVTFVRQHDNIPVLLDIEKPDGTIVQKTVVPEKNTRGKPSIGASVGARIDKVTTHKAKNIIEAVQLGTEATVKLSTLTANALYRAVTTGFAGSDVGGPIAVISAGSQMAQASPLALIPFAATLSVNLAILNALPYPALDGGQFVLAFSELVTGKKIPRKVQDYGTYIAFLILLGFSLSTVIGDFDKLFDPPMVRLMTPTD